MKEDSSLRLCLDPKDLNKVIERNEWCARTPDDILPELVQSKYFTVKDAILAHIITLKEQSTDYIQYTMG